MSKTSVNSAPRSLSLSLNDEMRKAIDAAVAAKSLEIEAASKAALEIAIAGLAVRKGTAKSAGTGYNYSGYSEGAAALIKAAGQRPQNDRAKLTALVYDNKRIPVADLCKAIGFVTDRHGNKTNDPFGRSDAMRVLRRVQADLLQSAQMYNLYIDVRNIDGIECLQLLDRSTRVIEPVSQVIEPVSPVIEPVIEPVSQVIEPVSQEDGKAS